MLQTATKTKSNLKELEEGLLSLDLESPEFEAFMAEIIKKYKQKKQKEEFEKWSETLPVMELTPEQEKELEKSIKSGTLGTFQDVEDLMNSLES